MRSAFPLLCATIAAVMLASSSPAQLPAQPGPVATPPAPRKAGPLPPLKFERPLPTGKVATIDGKDITQGQLLQHLLKGQAETVNQTLILGAVLDMELKKAKITITPEEIENEKGKILAKLAPGMTTEQVMKLGAYDEAQIRKQAWLQLGWDKLFMAENKLQPGNQTVDTTKIVLALFMRQRLEQYEVRNRGEDPGPEDGLIAEVRSRESGDVTKITADDALAFLIGLVKPASLRPAVNELVDTIVVDNELARTGKTVTEDEIEAWAHTTSTKYQAPFDWRMICRIKGTSPDAEKERWRRIQAHKRASGIADDPDTIKAFQEKYVNYFSGEHRNVSHILVMTQNPVTGYPLPPDELAKAKQKIEMIAAKLEEGVDFAYLAANYSEDLNTAAAKGVIQLPVKELGSGLDKAFQDAAWKLAQGEVSRPVQSSYGWHIIKCDKHTPAQSGRDLSSAVHQEWIRDEVETQMMQAWLAGLREKAKVEIVPDSELVKIKQIDFEK